MAKFSGPFMPRPPDTMISASVWSGSVVAATSTDFTVALILDASRFTATFSIAPAPATSLAPSALGLIEMTWGLPTASTMAYALPAYIGLLAMILSPSFVTATQSEMAPTLSLAATAGVKSLPCADALVRMTEGCTVCATCTNAWTNVSGT